MHGVQIAGLFDFINDLLPEGDIQRLLLLGLGAALGIGVIMIALGMWHKKIAANIKLGFIVVLVIVVLLIPYVLSSFEASMSSVFQ